MAKRQNKKQDDKPKKVVIVEAKEKPKRKRSLKRYLWTNRQGTIITRWNPFTDESFKAILDAYEHELGRRG